MLEKPFMAFRSRLRVAQFFASAPEEMGESHQKLAALIDGQNVPRDAVLERQSDRRVLSTHLLRPL